MLTISRSSGCIRSFLPILPVVHRRNLSTFFYENVNRSGVLTLSKRHITQIRREERDKFKKEIEIAIDQGKAEDLMKALTTFGESNLRYERGSYFFTQMLTKTFSHPDINLLKILIEAKVCSISLIEMMRCKTLEQAEIIAQIVGETQDERTKLLIANAIVREDVGYIQDQLNKNTIATDEFKKIVIYSLYPFQLIIPLHPLLIAINKKNLELVQVLVENGFSVEEDLSIPDFGSHLCLSPITQAYELEAHQIVDYLISKGAKMGTKFEVVHYGDDSLKDPKITISYQSGELKTVDRFQLLQEVLKITDPEKKD